MTLQIYTTASTKAKREYISERFGLSPDTIFSSTDTSFLSEVMKATSKKGVHVVLNSLSGDSLDASSRCCSSFGRFIEIGERNTNDDCKLGLSSFNRNVTFSTVDILSIFYHENESYHKVWSSLLDQVIELYRANKITKIAPIESFDISQTASALKHFSSRDRLGTVAITMETPKAKLKVHPLKYKTKFNPRKTYIMVGCLGGLGQSLSKWMVNNGARKFLFLGRSGSKKPSARRLIEQLIGQEVQCQVVKGDVCSFYDVQRVVDCVSGPIGGVVQAAMGLDACFHPIHTLKSPTDCLIGIPVYHHV